jgi:hypothetical protein
MISSITSILKSSRPITKKEENQGGKWSKPIRVAREKWSHFVLIITRHIEIIVFFSIKGFVSGGLYAFTWSGRLSIGRRHER